MIRRALLRYRLYCLRRQEEGLRAELAGVQAYLARNQEQQRRTLADLSLLALDARFKVAGQ